MSDATPPNRPATRPGRARLALRAFGWLAATAIACALIWQLVGHRLWKDYLGWQEAARAYEDSVPIGYVGTNYRRSYNDRSPTFLFDKDGKKLLWAAGGVGQHQEFYDVTDADFPVPEVEGGYGRDSIPGIDYPILEPPDGEHARSLRSRQTVFGLGLAAGPRAYPEDLLSKIDVVNDRDGATPFVVIYDRGRRRALCFGRDVGVDTVTFGTTGYSFRKSPLLYDRKTKILWIISGDAFGCVNGALKGSKPAPFKVVESVAWGEWHSRHPTTSVVVGNDRQKPIPLE
jgi:hypothetical protein